MFLSTFSFSASIFYISIFVLRRRAGFSDEAASPGSMMKLLETSFEM
jgi:hypothetical protein